MCSIQIFRSTLHYNTLDPCSIQIIRSMDAEPTNIEDWLYFIYLNISKILSFQHGTNIKVIIVMLYVLSFWHCFGNPFHILQLQHISVWMCSLQVLITHMWLVTATLDSTGLADRWYSFTLSERGKWHANKYSIKVWWGAVYRDTS